MRRTSHMGQKPRRSQLNAASLSWPQSLQRMRRQRRKKQWARVPHSRKVSNSALGVLLQVGSVCGLGEEGRGVLLNRVVQRGLFQAVVLVVNGGAARRPLGPPANGVNARLPKWRVCTVSKPALLLNRLECHRPVCPLRGRGASLGRRCAGPTSSSGATEGWLGCGRAAGCGGGGIGVGDASELVANWRDVEAPAGPAFRQFVSRFP